MSVRLVCAQVRLRVCDRLCKTTWHMRVSGFELASMWERGVYVCERGGLWERGG